MSESEVTREEFDNLVRRVAGLTDFVETIATGLGMVKGTQVIHRDRTFVNRIQARIGRWYAKAAAPRTNPTTG